MQGFDDQTAANVEYKFHPKFVFSLKNNILSGITFDAWLKILYKYIWVIEIKYYFRALFITLLSIFNSLLAMIEDYYYPRKMLNKIQLPDDPIIILGHPRTGTTLIHNLLSSDIENFYYCDTFTAGFPSAFLWFERYKSYFKGLLDKTRPMDSMPLTFELPGEDELATNVLSAGNSYYLPLIFMQQEQELRRYLDFNPELGATKQDEETWVTAFIHVLRKITYREQCRQTSTKPKRLILKSPVHTGRVHLLRRLFPRAKFVYVHRHPYVVFQSAAHMADTTYWYCYLNTPSNAQVTEFILWQFEYLWKTYNEAVTEGIEGSGTERRVTADTLEVSFAELTSSALGTLQKIYGHLGVEMDVGHYKRELESIKGYAANEHRELPGHIKELLRSRWQAYAITFNYQME